MTGISNMTINVSTHGSLAGADENSRRHRGNEFVSTHGSLAGADPSGFRIDGVTLMVSTHGSLAGADDGVDAKASTALEFQLTAPLREPT